MHIKKFLIILFFSSATLSAAPPIHFQYCLKKNEQECIKSMCRLKAQPNCHARCHAIAKDKCIKLSKQLRLPGE